MLASTKPALCCAERRAVRSSAPLIRMLQRSRHSAPDSAATIASVCDALMLQRSRGAGTPEKPTNATMCPWTALPFNEADAGSAGKLARGNHLKLLWASASTIPAHLAPGGACWLKSVPSASTTSTKPAPRSAGKIIGPSSHRVTSLVEFASTKPARGDAEHSPARRCTAQSASYFNESGTPQRRNLAT